MSAVKVQQLYDNLWQSLAVYSNPTGEKCPVLRVLVGHDRTLNQWVPGPAFGGSAQRRDPRPAHRVSIACGSLTLGGTGFESWWVHSQIPYSVKGLCVFLSPASSWYTSSSRSIFEFHC